MLLVIDSGNTNVVFAVYKNEKRLGVFRIANDPKRTADEYAVWLMNLMQLKKIEYQKIANCILASVVPETEFNLISLCQRYFNEPLVVNKNKVNLGIKILIDHPDQVGADRLVNVVGAFKKYGGEQIIIDFGTATTFDVMDKDGNYCGGIIAPGINLSVEALYKAAAKLPLVEVKPTKKIIGNSTITAMQSGIFWGYISMIEGLVARIKNEFHQPLEVIATGGLAELFANECEVIKLTDRGLTLDGLVEIFKLNTAVDIDNQ